MISRVHRGLDRLAAVTGYHVLPQWRLRHWAFATHLRTLFDSLRIDLVLDVGANKGQYRRFLRSQVGYDGPIVSFEPIKENVAVLERLARDDPRWTIRGCALGAESGTRAFNIMQRSTLSSLLPPDNREANAKLSRHNSVERVEQVTVARLADLWPDIVREHGNGVRAYLKLDTQGADLQVVEGARSVLDQIMGMQTELLLRPMYHGAPAYTDALLGLEQLGFDVAGLYPVSRDDSMRVRACDCTLVNRARISAQDAR